VGLSSSWRSLHVLLHNVYSSYICMSISLLELEIHWTNVDEISYLSCYWRSTEIPYFWAYLRCGKGAVSRHQHVVTISTATNTVSVRTGKPLHLCPEDDFLRRLQCDQISWSTLSVVFLSFFNNILDRNSVLPRFPLSDSSQFANKYNKWRFVVSVLNAPLSDQLK
jgi:hypothetical protein